VSFFRLERCCSVGSVSSLFCLTVVGFGDLIALVDAGLPNLLGCLTFVSCRRLLSPHLASQISWLCCLPGPLVSTFVLGTELYERLGRHGYSRRSCFLLRESVSRMMLSCPRYLSCFLCRVGRFCVVWVAPEGLPVGLPPCCLHLRSSVCCRVTFLACGAVKLSQA